MIRIAFPQLQGGSDANVNLPASPDGVAAVGCGGEEPATRRDQQGIEAAYAQRSVAILEEAVGGRTSQLRGMVAPSATFTLFEGDVRLGPRTTGADAAVEFASGIRPAAYQFSVTSALPSINDPCGETTAELLLTGSGPLKAVAATFGYRRGILVEVVARKVDLSRGQLAAVVGP